MKIRIKGNTIRYRLTKSDVERLANEGMIAESTFFANSTFSYQVVSSKGHDGLLVDMAGRTITLYIPEADAKDWHKSDKVGYYASQDTLNGQCLDITLEKDFVCMDETNEDQSDNYPNPKANINV